MMMIIIIILRCVGKTRAEDHKKPLPAPTQGHFHPFARSPLVGLDNVVFAGGAG